MGFSFDAKSPFDQEKVQERVAIGKKGEAGVRQSAENRAKWDTSTELQKRLGKVRDSSGEGE